MFSTYRYIAKVLPEGGFPFSLVTCSPDPQVPCRSNAVKLEKEAAACNENDSAKASAVTPNHIAHFYTNDVLKGLLDKMEIYEQKIKSMEPSSENWTCFHVNSAVIPYEFEYEEKLQALFAKLDENGRLGGKE